MNKSWFCFIGAIVAGVDWGVLLAWYTHVMITVAKCPYINCLKPRMGP